MNDVRRETRVKSILQAKVVYDNKNASIECQIRNMSRLGAKLIVDRGITFPQEFDLYLPQKGKVVRSRVIWRNQDETGVEFLNDDAPASRYEEGSDRSGRLAELERENAALRREIGMLKAQLEKYFDTV